METAGGRRPGVWLDVAPGVSVLSGSDVARLREAVGTGEAVTIVYAEGSQPGTKRDVLPKSVTRTELKAWCLAADAPRRFLMEHVRVVAADSDVPLYVKGAGTAKRRLEPGGPRDVLARQGAEIEALGWHAMASDDALTLFARDAVGLPVPTVSIGLGRCDRGGGRISWAVQDPRGKRRTRKRLDSAEKMLMETARKWAAEPVAARTAPQRSPLQSRVRPGVVDRIEALNAREIAALMAAGLLVGIGLGMLL
jgi:hypothetical protein